MEKRTAEIIMVLKGNTNLDVDVPTWNELSEKYSTNSEITDNEYFYLVALYMSNDCVVPVSYYYKNPHVIESVIHTAVVDYARNCDNPDYLLRQYFAAKYRWEDKSEIEHWCSAFVEQQVKELVDFNEEVAYVYINGFTEENTQYYERQRPFFEDFED